MQMSIKNVYKTFGIGGLFKIAAVCFDLSPSNCQFGQKLFTLKLRLFKKLLTVGEIKQFIIISQSSNFK